MFYHIIIGFGTDIGAKISLDTSTKQLLKVNSINDNYTRIVLGQFPLSYHGIMASIRWYYKFTENLSDTDCLNQIQNQNHWQLHPISSLAS